MLLDRATLQGIVDGRIRLVFRRGLRPTVKAAGTLRTTLGVLAIESVDEIEADAVTSEDARLAGHASRAALLASLSPRPGTLYRIGVRPAGADPRIALRTTPLSAAETDALVERLARMDRASRGEAWTRAVLEAIERHPARLAARLAKAQGLPTALFKQRVRRLKELGLTESLEVGYRLAPRGVALLEQLRGRKREP